MTSLVTAKNLKDVTLSGVTLDWEKRDSQIASVTITDANGGMVRISKTNTYSDGISIFVPEPPKFEDRWVLKGEFAGCLIRKQFDTERDAHRTRNDFPSDAALTVEKTSVRVDENGSAAFAESDSDIPF